jgi:AcrR family transcriptional regulator
LTSDGGEAVVTRREELAEGATDYALAHGLIGLSLRPLAEALGTSDRMLLYHFRDKDDLVATILHTSNTRSVSAIRALAAPPDVRRAVLELWRLISTGPLQQCQRLYVEAAALGLLGRQPYAALMREENEAWMSAVAEHFRRAGLDRRAAVRAATLVDAAFMGVQLDESLDSEAEVRRTVRDLADAVSAHWGQSGKA